MRKLCAELDRALEDSAKQRAVIEIRREADAAYRALTEK